MLVLQEPDARSLHNRFCDTQSDIGRFLSMMPSTLSHNVYLYHIHTHEGADHWASGFYNIGTLTICEPDGRYFHVYYLNPVSYHGELSDLMPALQWYKIHPSITFIYKVRGRELRDPHSWPLHNPESIWTPDLFARVCWTWCQQRSCIEYFPVTSIPIKSLPHGRVVLGIQIILPWGYRDSMANTFTITTLILDLIQGDR